MTFETQMDVARAEISAGRAPTSPHFEHTSQVCAWLSLLTETGLWAQLWTEVRRWRHDAVWSDSATLQAAVGLLCAGEDDRALALLCESGVAQPSADSCFAIAEDIYVGEQFTLARRWLSTLEAVFPRDFRLNLLRGGIELAQGQHESAITYLQSVLSDHPNVTVVLEPLAAAYQHALRQYAKGSAEALLDIISPQQAGPGQLKVLLRAALMLGHWPLIAYLVERIAVLEQRQRAELEAGKFLSLLDAQFFESCRAILENAPFSETAFQELRFQLCWRLGDMKAAYEAMRAVQRMEPENAVAHFNAGFALLAMRQWRAGWESMEWRFRVPDRRNAFRDQTYDALPLWDGKPTEKTVIVCTEQGLGDAVQMMRYLPEAMRRVGGIAFELVPTLMSLLGALDTESVNNATEASVTLEAVEAPSLRLPLMSLPLLLDQPVPTGAAYLHINQDVIDRTRPWLSTPGVRVGLVWEGSRTHGADRDRSMHLFEMLPLLAIPGVSFHILQRGPGISQLTYLPDALPINRTDLQINDMADLAGVIAQLDLVISIDSMPAHLAGALGVPVWMLLSTNIDYRWGVEGEITPWYDSMRLFRQTRQGDWHGVVQRVEQALHTLVAGRGYAPDRGCDMAVISRIRAAIMCIPDLSGICDQDVAVYRAILDHDDRHVGAMMGMARVYLDHRLPFKALFWATEATHFAGNCVATWQLLLEVMQALAFDGVEMVEKRIEDLTALGAPANWFGWCA